MRRPRSQQSQEGGGGAAGLGRGWESSVGWSVRLGQQEEGLLGSFGFSPVGFAVHLLVRAVASAFPGHPAGHDKRQVPSPGDRGTGSAGPARVAEVSSHVSKQSLEGH